MVELDFSHMVLIAGTRQNISKEKCARFMTGQLTKYPTHESDLFVSDVDMVAYWDENMGRLMAPTEKIRPPVREFNYFEQREMQ